MNRRLLAGAFVLATGVTAPACLSGIAAAATACGGQSAPPQPVPYTCSLPGIDITAQGFTRHFSAVVFADGGEWVRTDSTGIASAHQRKDILAMLDRGDFS